MNNDNTKTAMHTLISYISEHYNTPASEIHITPIAFNKSITGWRASMETLYPVDAYFTVVFNMNTMTVTINEYRKTQSNVISCEIIDDFLFNQHIY